MALALIDADSIYFRAAYSNSDKAEIRKVIDTTVNQCIAYAFSGPQECRVALKGRGNYRKDLYTPYKGTRPALKEEIKESLNYGHNYMKEKWGGVEADGMEADDLVCIWAYEAREMELDFVICGIDKDLKQIPGHHYNYTKKTHEFVNDDQADLNLMLQCLTGDTSDNIPGINGIGPKKAAKILEGVPMGQRWTAVEKAWKENNAGDPWVSRKLLTMLTTWDELKEVSKNEPDESLLLNQTPECEQNVEPKREDNVQVSGLPGVSEPDS